MDSTVFTEADSVQVDLLKTIANVDILNESCDLFNGSISEQNNIMSKLENADELVLYVYCFPCYDLNNISNGHQRRCF